MKLNVAICVLKLNCKSLYRFNKISTASVGSWSKSVNDSQPIQVDDDEVKIVKEENDGVDLVPRENSLQLFGTSLVE